MGRKTGPKKWGEDRTYSTHYQAEYKKCGKSNCSTCTNGLGHGPYWYRYQYDTALKKVVKTHMGKEKPGQAE